MEKIDFKFSVPIQIKMSDLDPFNHVNNGIQCNYFDYGRSAYFEQVFQEPIDWSTFDLVLVHVDLDFHSGIEFNDKITCRSKVTEIGYKSFKMVQQLIEETTGIVKTTCHSVICGFDRQTRQSIPLQDKYVEKFRYAQGECC